MLTFHFQTPLARDVFTVGPAPHFRLFGNTLCAGPNDQVVATYQGGYWHTEHGPFVVLTTSAPTQVRFEGSLCDDDYGPFDEIRLVDGAIRYGLHPGKLLATLNEQKLLWHLPAHSKDCPNILFTAPN